MIIFAIVSEFQCVKVKK